MLFRSIQFLIFLILAVSLGNYSAEARPRAHVRSIQSLKAKYNLVSKKVQVSWGKFAKADKYSLKLTNTSTGEVFRQSKKIALTKLPLRLFEIGSNYNIRIEALRQGKIFASRNAEYSFASIFKTNEVIAKTCAQNSGKRNGAYFLPKNYMLRSLPLLLAIHGSSIKGKSMVNLFIDQARVRDFIVVAPDSNDPRGWEVSTDLTDLSNDQKHIYAVLNEVMSLPNINVDSSKIIIAGVSAGGGVAALQGSHDTLFKAFAVLHGGVLEDAIGSNITPAWLSTGSEDKLRPPEELQGYLSILQGLTFPSVYHEYPGGHVITQNEKEEMINWWLGPPNE